MDSVTTYEVIRQTIMTTLISSAPVLIVALAVGLVIAFFQALTQIQEMTLTFVPKIAAIFVTLALSLPFIFSTLLQLSDRIFDLISNGGV
ncbi:flagellar biosynthesis protein FliQ [Sulfitobacter mediterraneus]|uniref:Flagellar biosynthetic protein FliQ n=1 Tax=Sulfitobacter mediterraneus TaxID=83219 RepID=A0A061SJX5_9RHOB|nr:MULTISPECIES: flagellar biosynthesis protein FliQ [Sulfitobacter]KAJ02026.1 flagellar biosynthesis protein FliQ [Sulfitobacter mediterraneus]MBM1312056.1 flagellar biosynthesis protein FliQ [Sulfitobacter mediterraneus]MBM1315936.1 flagellar biosynthesis protein FliQ [Sulfitobacter mediterraneus]MBM1324299.1 flagellar biosynthesis protein FliQ [Sulfitobacter mediterraneus]MBM1328210.1 flagellar biosynthesis protein FliQ [Sulfitobacter mediterraneus]